MSTSGFSGISRVVRGGLWLYGSSIVANFSGFIYWMVISAIAGSEALGLTSATVGLASLINGLLGLGIGVGLRRFLGQCVGLKDRECLSRYFWTAVLFTTIVYVSVSLILYTLGSLGYSLWNYTPEMLRIASLIVLLGIWPSIDALPISLLRTDIVLLGAVIGNIVRFAVGISLVYLGFGWVGAAIGNMLLGLTRLSISLAYALRVVGFKLVFSTSVLIDVLRAGIVSWMPSIVVLAGRWLSVLFVFGSSGAIETGYYYVANAISGVVLGVATSILSLLLPVLSSMADGRKRAVSRALKISLLFMTPIAVYVATYSWLPLGLLGREYVSASTILTILLLSSVPLTITASINSLVYAYGYYRMVLAIGLSQNIPRIILYFFLVPSYGGLGAAISFTLGAYSGLLCSLLVARKVGFYLDARSIGIVIGIPSLLGVVSFALNLHWFIGLLVIASSYILYARLRVFSRKDLKDILLAFMTREEISRLYEKLRPIVDTVLPP